MATLHFDEGTPAEVQAVIQQAHANGDRIRVWYGDTETGRAWSEELDVMGVVGRSTGRLKVPLLLNNSRSTGGPSILTASIVRIDDTMARRTLYKHPSFSTGLENAKIVPNSEASPHPLGFGVVDDEGVVVAGFSTEAKAQKWIDFMVGKRYSK